MRNVFGNQITITLFGESHGSAVGCVIDGLPSGFSIDETRIQEALKRRHSYRSISTERKEPDAFQILSGYRNGKMEGTPLTILIENQDVSSKEYDANQGILRPSHADYVAHVRYQGNEDARGGGHFSGRLTAPLVVAGNICEQLLERKGIVVASHVVQLGEVYDHRFSMTEPELQVKQLKERFFPTLSSEVKEEMIQVIQQAKEEKDSLGGRIETVVTGIPVGIGEPFFDTLEGQLAKAMFAIPAVKGILFGAKEEFVTMKGSEVNDSWKLSEGKLVTKTNYSGGIQGGLSDGMPILFDTIVKPTPSIGLPQETVDLNQNEEVMLEIQGRHDSAIVHRANIVVESMTAFVIADFMAQYYGIQWID